MSTHAAVEDLRNQVEEQRLKAELADLERVLRAADLESRTLMESQWGDIVDRREYLYDTPGWGPSNRDGRISRPDDRARGMCRPFFENELDLANIRGIGRFLGTAMDTGAGILENLTNYTIGNGFTYEVQSNETGAWKQLVAAVQVNVDDFNKQLAERESFIRGQRDGDWFTWVREFQGEPVPEFVEPEFVTEPTNSRAVEDYCERYGLDWFLGVASQPNRPARVVGYFVQWYGSNSDWDFVPAAEMVHAKLNVDTGVKRGISDFYPVYLTLERAMKLLGNTLQGAAVQAAIAFIRKHASGMSNDSVTSFATSKADRTATVQVGDGLKFIRGKKYDPGTIIDTTGTDYVAGPLGQNNAPIYIQVIQAAFRVAGARWAMPEYMISGDASNANYASTLVAGGPFDRATQARQNRYKEYFEEAHWKALGIRCRLGQFARYGIHTLTELKQVLRLHVTPPTVAVQDAEKEEAIRKIRYDAGILSPTTWSNQVGLDRDAEIENGAKPVATAAGPGAQSPQLNPGQPAPGNPVADAESSLNGAQITAAITVLDNLSAGRSTVDIALGLLLAVGIDEAMARRMVNSAKTVTPPPANPDPKQAAVTAALESVKTTAEARAILRESYP